GLIDGVAEYEGLVARRPRLRHLLLREDVEIHPRLQAEPATRTTATSPVAEDGMSPSPCRQRSFCWICSSGGSRDGLTAPLSSACDTGLGGGHGRIRRSPHALPSSGGGNHVVGASSRRDGP